MTRSRILLADDHELFREGLAGLITSQPDMEVVGQASDGFEAATLARQLRPDLLITDISMPVCDGLEAIRMTRQSQAGAGLRILVLTVHDEDAKLFEAIRAGANGYLLKNTSATDFLRTVRAALAGEALLPPKLAARLLDEFTRLARRAPTVEMTSAPNLTEREQEVLALIAQDLTDQAIARQLSISLHTAKSHVRNILAKLHAVNRHHAVQIASGQADSP
ncbi:MAG: response regulator transcription factor [Caldilineaceae bacterium]|nr:response regulator transcription factor [Caldilineaceae bacterium]HRJ40329.1 response regulator transcription factor [Caldilineaceae bacterium]